jgi:putative membrane protein
MTTSRDRATTEAAESPTLRESVPPLREWVTTYVVGLCMGMADGVPGVSGGTIALIAGVYERLIEAITAATPQRGLRLLGTLSPLDGVALDETVSILDELDVWFLAALGAGVATAVVTMSKLVEFASENHPVLMFGLFFGLIAASAVILLRETELQRADQIAAAVAGFLLAFVVSGATSGAGTGSANLAVVFVAGAIGVSAMILPGISGSLLLVIVGQYDRMFSVLSTFTDRLAALVTGGSLDRVFDPGVTVVTFMLGGVVGLLTISRVVDRALDANRGATLAFLVALVVGALRAPVAEIRHDVGFSTDVGVAFAGAAVVGAILVLVLDFYAIDIDLDAA